MIEKSGTGLKDNCKAYVNIFLKTVLCMILYSFIWAGTFEVKADTVSGAVDLSKWDNAQEIKVSETKVINITDTSDEQLYVFTPTSGEYYNVSLKGSSVYCRIGIYNSQGVAEFETYKYYESKNNDYKFKFKEGEKYYLVFGAQSTSGTGSYTVVINSINKSDVISILYDENIDYYDEPGENVEDSIEFDLDTNTLTLSGYHGRYISINADIINTMEDFTIMLYGDNEMIDNTYSSYINGNKVNLTIKGEGTLTIGDGRQKAYIEVTGNLLCDCKKITINNLNETTSNAITCASFRNDVGGNFTLLSGDVLVNMYANVKEGDTYVSVYFEQCISVRKDIVFKGGGFRVHYIYPDEVATDKEIKVQFAVDVNAAFLSYIGNVYIDDSSDKKAQVIIIADKEIEDVNITCIWDKGIKYYETEGVIIGNIIDINKLAIDCTAEKYTYDGKEKKPLVTIAGLEEGVDYVVEYKDNINPGTGKVIIKGLGLYTGSKTFEFEIIIKADSSKADGPKAGAKIRDKKYIYKVTKAGSRDGKIIGELKVIGLKKKSLKQIKIAANVTISGVKYKVTSIGAKAFKGNKKIIKVTIGKNIKTIGASAFAGCKKILQVTINSKKLKTIGKNAFKGDKKLKKIIIKSEKVKKLGKNSLKGTSKKLVVRVPKNKRKTYKKLIKKAGNKKAKVK